MNYVNGKPCNVISVHDRGLLYGQSVFETIAVVNSELRLLEQHLNRLQRGATAMGIPYDGDTIEAELAMAVKGVQEGVLRFTLTMGESGRGYLNPTHPKPTRIISLHSYPDYPSRYWQQGIVLGLCEQRLGHQNTLTGLKHGNRLDQVTARSQWQESWHEALLLNQHEHVIEATSANVFAVIGDQLLTPILDGNAVEGVMRNFIIELAKDHGLSTKAMSLSVPDIQQADALFLTNALIGVWPVKRFMQVDFSDFSVAHALIQQLLNNEIIPHH